MEASGSKHWYIEEISADGDDDSECNPDAIHNGLKGAAAMGYRGETLVNGEERVDAANDDSINEKEMEDFRRENGAASRSRWTCSSIMSRSTDQVPSPRGGCSWTKVGAKYILFGGADSSQQHFADVHSFDLRARRWVKNSTGGTLPSPRSGHSAVALGDSLIVYGGMNATDNVTFNDIFELQTGSMQWEALPCTDAPPRNSHCAVLREEIMIVIGGASPEGQTDDVFTIDLSDRSNLSCRRVPCSPARPTASLRSNTTGQLPAAKEMHSACLYISRTDESTDPCILVMGGRSVSGVHQDLFSLNTVSWAWTRLKDAPVLRCAHTACLFEETGIMAVFGGWDGAMTVANDLHLYEVLCDRWTAADVSPRPVGRFAHVACASGETNVLIFGGVNPVDNPVDVALLTRG